MFRISPADAMTEMYGISRADAQVFDNTPMIQSMQLAQRERARKEAVEEKKGEARDIYVQSQIKTLYKGKVLPAEQTYFADEANKIRDNVIKQISVTGHLSTQDVMKAEFDLADLTQRTEVSQNYREDLEKKIFAVETQGKHKFRKKEVDSLYAAYARVNKGDIGANYQPIQLHQQTDYMKEVVVPTLNPIAKAMTQQTGRKHEFNLDDAKEIVATNLQDADNYEDAAYKFNEATPEQRGGATTPLEWYQNMYAPILVRDNVTPASTGRGGSVGGGSASAKSAVLTEQPDGTWELYSAIPTGHTLSGKFGKKIYEVHSTYNKKKELTGGWALDADAHNRNEDNARKREEEHTKLDKELLIIDRDYPKIAFVDGFFGGNKTAVAQREALRDAEIKLVEDERSLIGTSVENEKLILTIQQTREAQESRLKASIEDVVLDKTKVIVTKAKGAVAVKADEVERTYKGVKYTYTELKKMATDAGKTEKDAQELWSNIQ